MDWSLGGEGLSLAAAQGRAPQEGPGEGSPCLSLAKEYGFTLKVMQKTKASHSGQESFRSAFRMGCPGCGAGRTD